MVTGFAMTAVISAFAMTAGIPGVSVILPIASAFGIVELFDHATFWSISYTAGYLVSVAYFGKYFWTGGNYHLRQL